MVHQKSGSQTVTHSWGLSDSLALPAEELLVVLITSQLRDSNKLRGKIKDLMSVIHFVINNCKAASDPGHTLAS